MNKKIIALGLLAGFFFMNKSEESTSTNTNTGTGGGTGSGTGSGGFGGTAGSLPTGAGGTNNTTCDNYKFNGIVVCEDLLPDYDFFWWDGLDGPGWYNLNQFRFSRPGAQNIQINVNGVSMSFPDAIKEWLRISSDVGNANYTSAMSNLRNYYTSGGPLAAA